MASNDTIKKTLIVTILLCLVCSVIVAGSAVLLKPVQKKNQQLSLHKNILSIAGMLDPNQPVDKQFKRFTPALVDLRTGKFSTAHDPSTFSARAAVKNRSMSQSINSDEDIAKIKHRANFATVYLVKNQGKLDIIVLPVYGQGLWSTMYGYIALKGDLRTVVGFGFYEQGETPGLGGEVDNPKWKALWPGKQIYNPQGDLALEVIKGSADPKAKDYQYKVDGLAGASLTTKGVQNLLQYWMGKNGFKIFLKNLKAGEA